MSVKILRICSVFYLMLPNILFFYSWTSLPITFIGILILFYLFYTEIGSDSFFEDTVIDKKDIFLVALTAGILTLISGVSGLCYQVLDYWVHNTKFYDLVSNEWPIRFPEKGAVVSYYFGYYVVPAMFFKIVGVFDEAFILLWTILGIGIGLMWVYIVLNKKMIFVLLALCFGDFSHVFDIFLRSLSINLYSYGDFGIEHWSNFENLFWVPNQIIPTLIIGGMLGYILTRKLDFYLIVLPIALSFWWAIFPAFTSSLLVAILFVREMIVSNFALRWSGIIRQILIPFLSCLPILLFFLSHNETPVSGFIWSFRGDTVNSIFEYMVNIGVNVIAFLLSYYYLRKHNYLLMNKSSFVIVLILIVLLPLYRLGKVNDFLFRGMMPLLLIAGLHILYPLTQNSYRNIWNMLKSSAAGLALILFLICSSFLGVRRIYRAVSVNVVTAKLGTASFTPIPYDLYPNVYEALKDKWTQQEANQYLGKADSFYEKYIARPVE